MAYVPNPDDATQPTDAIDAETAQAEFRALKGKVNNLALSSGIKQQVRQCVLDALTAAGLAAFLSTTAGLTANLLASASPMILSYALGFNNAGAADAIVDIGTDQNNFWTALPANNVNFLAIDNAPIIINTSGVFTPGSAVITGIPSTTGMAIGQILTGIPFNVIPIQVFTIQSVDSATQITCSSAPAVLFVQGYSFTATNSNNISAISKLAPPQYDYRYSRNRQSVLQFGTGAASTSFLDDFGNTWTAQGGAKVQANSFKFGIGGLGGAGTANALNGAADYIKSTSFTTVPTEQGWSLRCWVNPSSLPGVGVSALCINMGNNNAFGAILGIANVGGTIKFAYWLSSNGSSHDIASSVQGTTTPVVGTYYFIELTFDKLTSTYRMYINGTQESSTVSGAVVNAVNGITLGAAMNATNFFNGYIDKFELLPYCQHPAGTVYAVPIAAPNIVSSGYASDWFDIVNMQMLQVAAASVVAGNNPAFTQIKRVYVGEANTNGAAVTGLVSYAIRGEYVPDWTLGLPGTNTALSFSDNIGTFLADPRLELLNLITDNGYTPGIILNNILGGNASFDFNLTVLKNTRNGSYATSGSNAAFVTQNLGSGNVANLTAGSWGYRIRTRRAF